MTPVLIGVLVAGAAGAAIAAAVAADRRRQASLSEYCHARGFRFEREHRKAEQALLDGFPVFREGRQRRWRWTISGVMGGQPFTAFEYTYVKGGGSHSKRHRFAMLLWEAPEARLPRFNLVPEGWLKRLGQRFGVKDFDFDVDPEFSRAYQLQGDDEAAVRALFTPGRRAFLMAPPPGPMRRSRSGIIWLAPGPGCCGGGAAGSRRRTSWISFWQKGTPCGGSS
jgi:hypothetical protein